MALCVIHFYWLIGVMLSCHIYTKCCWSQMGSNLPYRFQVADLWPNMSSNLPFRQHEVESMVSLPSEVYIHADF